MLLTAEELLLNLSRLRTSLNPCCAPSDGHESAARKDAINMPLTHATSETGFHAVVASAALLSPKARGARARHADQALGRTDDVCLYFGGAAFPEKEIALLFSYSLTDACGPQAVSTPFDSGGCVKMYPLPPGTDSIAFVAAHTMPVPACRDYLGDLLTTHFVGTAEYLACNFFACPTCGQAMVDPHGHLTTDPDHLVRTHELRVPVRVSLSRPHLLAIFVPKGLDTDFLEPLERSGVKLVTYLKAGRARTYALRKATAEFITKYLRTESES